MLSQPPIKILYCIDSLERSGTELQLIGLIDRLDRSRFDPHLLTIRPSDPGLTPRNCRYLNWDVPRLLSPTGASALWRLRSLLRREGFQVVQTFFQDSTLLGGTAAKLAGVPIRLASFRDLGFWRTPRQMLLLQRVYGMMTGFLANAEVVKRNFMEHDGLRDEDIQVIYNGIDVSALPWVEHNGPTVNIGIVGNLTREVKRTDLFLQAASLVTRRTGRQDLRWHVIGDGHLRPSLEKQAMHEGLADSVVFTGRIHNVAHYLEQLEIGVLCSDSEGFSNALLEYMLKGCACVATKVGGNPEAIQHNISGLLVPPNDPEALAAALQRLIEDTDLRRRLAQAARRHCEVAYSWEKCLQKHALVYDPPPHTGAKP